MMKKRLFALFLVLTMVLSSIVIPGRKVEAASSFKLEFNKTYSGDVSGNKGIVKYYFRLPKSGRMRVQLQGDEGIDIALIHTEDLKDVTDPFDAHFRFGFNTKSNAEDVTWSVLSGNYTIVLGNYSNSKKNYSIHVSFESSDETIVENREKTIDTYVNAANIEFGKEYKGYVDSDIEDNIGTRWIFPFADHYKFTLEKQDIVYFKFNANKGSSIFVNIEKRDSSRIYYYNSTVFNSKSDIELCVRSNKSGSYKAVLPKGTYYITIYPGCYNDIEYAFYDFTVTDSLTELLNNPPTVYNGVDYKSVYDFNYYINKYSDLKRVFGIDPEGALRHFVNSGMKEGRMAKSTFDVKSYRNKYQDLRIAYGRDYKKYYEHYMKYGYREGRKATGVNTLQNPVTKLNGVDYSKVYDYYYYINHNADVKKAFGDDDVAVLKHFINNGMKEGRRAKESFDLKSYKNAYRDLRAAFGNNNKDYYMHYINHGYKEKRVATGVNELRNGTTVYNGVDYSRVYNYTYYVNKYPDIKKAFGNDENAVIRHFVNNGMKEGRQGSANFNLQKYKSRYADLRKAYGSDNVKYYTHYMRWGYNEKRKAN
jgi:hypothetical protein